MLIAVCLLAAAAAPPTTTAAPPTTLEERAAAALGPNLVLVGTRDEKTRVVTAVGSGVVVTPGQVLTTTAVVDATTGAVFVVDRDGVAWPAQRRVDVKDPELTLLTVPGLSAASMKITASPAPAVGAAVAVVGAPLLDAPRARAGTLRSEDAARVAVSPGGVGGAVVNDNVEVVGVVVGVVVDGGEPLAGFIPAQRVLAFFQKAKLAQPAPAPTTTTTKLPPADVGIPVLVAPPSPDRERLQKLSDAALAEALAAKKPAQQEALLLTAAAWNPWSSAPWVRLARLYDEDGRFALAQAAYEAVAALREEHRVDSCALAALSLQKHGAPIPAERVARRCLRESPKHALSLAVAASARADRGDFKGAAPELRQALQLDPSLAWVHGVLGAGLAASNKLDEAIAEYRQAVAGAPDNAGLYFALGEALVQKQDVDGAIAVYRSAKVKDAGLSARLGELLLAKGKKAEAKKALQQALKLDPTNEAAKAALAKL